MNASRRDQRGPATAAPRLKDRLPPHSDEMERGVLGCVLLGLEARSACEEAGVKAEWFYDLRHGTVFEAVMGLHAAGKPVDLALVAQRLKEWGRLDEVGGLAFLASLPDAVPSAANLPSYLDAVREHWRQRSLLQTCAKVSAQVWEAVGADGTTEAGLAVRESALIPLRENQASATEQRIRTVMTGVVEEIEDYHRGRPQMRGAIETGLTHLDKVLCGLGGKNGNYIVLSARPGMGKTSLAMQILQHVALDYVWFDIQRDAEGKPLFHEPDERGNVKYQLAPRTGMPVSMLSLEMSPGSLGQRLLFQRAKADLQRWRTGYAENEDFPPIIQANGELCLPNNILIDDVGRCTIDAIKAKARRQVRQYGIKLFVLDYIQLIRCDAKKWRDDRVQELSEISGELFSLSKELQVPFIVLAQMNRDFEKDPKRKPRLSDLKDCGSIEQDADLVMFLHEPKLDKEREEKIEGWMSQVYQDDWSRRAQLVNAFVCKNRFGPNGSAEMLFEKSSTRFIDLHDWAVQHGFENPRKGEAGSAGKRKTIGPTPEEEAEMQRRWEEQREMEMGEG